MNEILKDRYLRAKRALFDTYYKAQNDRQREAIFRVNGPLLVIAGAGSGKTTVLVKRIAFMIRFGNAYYSDFVPEDTTDAVVQAIEAAKALPREEMAEYLDYFAEDPVPPYAVLAITFTNKAANEIKARLVSELGDEACAKEIWAGTFHSICMRILRRHAELLGYPKEFSVCDMDDAKKLVTACLKELNIDEKAMAPRAVMSAISRAKDQLKTPDMYEAEVGSDFKLRQIAKVYRMYQAKLVESGLLDFDDIIMKTVTLFAAYPDICERYARRFRYVSVDEYQDTNVAQLKLTLQCSSVHGNIMVVGDDDQSIYKFRGATIENILNFDKSIAGTRVIKLEQNYRSTGRILKAANSIISNNKGRRGKNLWTAGDDGELITVRCLGNQNDEARYIIRTVDELVKNGASYRDVAILYRTNAQSNSLESAFAKSGVPYRMLGGLRFYDRKEIRDMIAYLCLINNPNDNLRLGRIINEPKRKIGPAAMDAISAIADEEHKPMLAVMRSSADYTALKNYAPRLTAFATMIDSLRVKAEEVSVSALIETVFDMTGYRQMLIAQGEEGADRLDNVSELISAAIEYEEQAEEPSLSEFLEEVALVSDIDKYDDTADAVVMMTIHSSKGLEFPIVFLPGMEDGLFPGMQSIGSEADMEEERRLAYVAVTRAKSRLFITHVRDRLLYGRTQFNPISRFVSEIPSELLDAEKPQKTQSTGAAFSRPRTAYAPFGAAGASRTAATATSAPPKKTAPAESFSAGETVIHATFGRGVILSVKPMGGDILYEIVFDTVGTKKIMATYARMKRAEG